MYVLCSECARLIDLTEGDPPKREVEGADLVRHAAEKHAAWLEVLEFAPHPAEIVRRCSLPVSTAAFAVLKILEPADYLLAPLHSASRLAWREVTERGKRFGDYSAVMAIEKLVACQNLIRPCGDAKRRLDGSRRCG